MPFLQPLGESLSLQDGDPWDWTVAQVVFSLTNEASPLLQAHPTLSMPDATHFADVLYENDVNGLALLHEVQSDTLKDDLGIKSMGHRASIKQLIRELQRLSTKYQEELIKSGRGSSSGLVSRFETPFMESPHGFNLRALPNGSTLWKSPVTPSNGFQSPSRGEATVTSTQERPAVPTRDILAEAPKLPKPDWQKHYSTNNTNGLEIAVVEAEGKNGTTPEEIGSLDAPEASVDVDTQCAEDTTRGSLDAPRLSRDVVTECAEDIKDLDSPSVGQNTRPGEMAIIDKTGRRRRRLVLASADTPIQEDPDSSQLAPQSMSDQSGAPEPPLSTLPLSHPADQGKKLAETCETTMSAEDEITIADHPIIAAEPGALVVDENGRKRMRPILVAEPEPPLEIAPYNPTTSPQSSSNLSAPPRASYRKPGRKANRTKSQIYLGFESLSVEKLFYGDTPLESELDHRPIRVDDASDSDDFVILPDSHTSNGLSLYVNSRLRYYLQCERMELQNGKGGRNAILPYPDRIGRKHHPLSLTIFTPSTNGITVLRSNRSKWIKDTSASINFNQNQDEADAFNIADPVLAHDEEHDTEWTALEKWKYLDDEDHVLPVYGESGSEGEYELDTWTEIEQERGELPRPAGVSKSQKLAAGLVEETITSAIERMQRDWELKKRPRLEAKAWRLWMKSRRENNAKEQMKECASNIDWLDKRLQTHRAKIAEEEWSKLGQLSKACTIMEPTIFDREAHKWKLALLASHKIPKKPAPGVKKPKVVKQVDVELPLNDDGENLVTDFEAEDDTSDTSYGDLDDFIVSDDPEAGDHQSINPDDGLFMADEEDAVDSEILVEKGYQIELPVAKDQPSKSIDSPQMKSEDEPLIKSCSKISIVDLTLDSDPVESENLRLERKPKPAYEIKTPPILSSENESDVFARSRGKKAVFKKLALPQVTHTKVIDLETDLSDATTARSSTVVKKLFPELPALSNVRGISQMDPSILVERQDRKRLLTWTLAHAPPSRRHAALSYLTSNCSEVAHARTDTALQIIPRGRRRMPDEDNEISDVIMAVASWRVCWTVPVKLDPSSGLKVAHVEMTLADKEGFEAFHDFLLVCLNSCSKDLDGSESLTPVKKRQKIIRGPEETLSATLSRKRKYAVTESQETLNRRQAAQDRMHGDEERRRDEQRRRKELGIKDMGSSANDSREIIVNPGKLEDQEYIYLNPKFGAGLSIKEHQKEGLQFLWREITGEHEDLQGCLLAQTMGLGKTMQVIALLVTLSEASLSTNENIRLQVPPTLRESRTLILCPPALLENWWDEFLIWAPRPFSNSFGELRKVSVSLRPAERLREIREWSNKGGVLLIGYNSFKSYIHNDSRKSKGNIAKIPLGDDQHRSIREALLDRTNLVVADEAHAFKGMTSKINKAINQFRTRSRIALSGSPLNNNLQEYYTLIDWISPNYLGTYTEFKANYEEPIQDGLYQDSTTGQYQRSRTKLKALELEMEPKVHRANISVLHTDLQGKFEFVVRVPLTTLQEELYRIYVDAVRESATRRETGQTSLWVWLGVLQLLCNHPKCFMDKMLALREAAKEPPITPMQSRKADKDPPEESAGGSEEDALLGTVTPTALSRVVGECEQVFQHSSEPTDALSLSLSNKMQILMKILELSEAAKDKVLVFSHRIATLDYIGQLLDRNQKSYARIDGAMLPQKRQPITKDFNEGHIGICLISTRAGGTGLNLYGANRVVILDESFNPAHEMQAVGRAYRIGQQKVVYVYRLTAEGTFEQAIQNQSLFKEQLANRVVDRKNPSRNAKKGAGDYLFPPKPAKQEPLDKHVGKDPLVLDHLLADRLQYRILSIIPSETLHIEDDMPLTEEMRIEAEKMVEHEQLRRRDPKAHSDLMHSLMQQRIQSVKEHTKITTSQYPAANLAHSSTQPNLWSSTIGLYDSALPSSTAPLHRQHMGGLPNLDNPIANTFKPLNDFSNGAGFSMAYQAPRFDARTFDDPQLTPDLAEPGAPSDEPPGMPFSALNLSASMNHPPPPNEPSPTSPTKGSSTVVFEGAALETNKSNRQDLSAPEQQNYISPYPAEAAAEEPTPDAHEPSTISKMVSKIMSMGKDGSKKGNSSPKHANGSRDSPKERTNRKHSLPSEQANQTKKRKSGGKVSPHFNAMGNMESDFQKLLDKEKARSAK